MTHVEEADFEVTLTIRLSTRVSFAAREMPEGEHLTKSDAIANAIAMLPEGPLSLFDGFGGEFVLALPIDGEATLL